MWACRRILPVPSEILRSAQDDGKGVVWESRRRGSGLTVDLTGQRKSSARAVILNAVKNLSATYKILRSAQDDTRGLIASLHGMTGKDPSNIALEASTSGPALLYPPATDELVADVESCDLARRDRELRLVELY